MSEQPDADPTTVILPEMDPQYVDQTEAGLPETPDVPLTAEQRWIWVWNSDIDRGRYPGDPDAPPLPEPSDATGRWVAMAAGDPVDNNQ